MKSSPPILPVVVLAAAACCLSPTFAQDSPNSRERSETVRQALTLVQQYIAVETAETSERIDSRREMLEFEFRATRENGRYRVLGEDDWREWERDRSGGREVRRLAVLGEPHVEPIGRNLYRVRCAVHLEQVENGEAWQGVALRSFEVSLDEDGTPRIRHERELASREGSRPPHWKRVQKIDSPSRSNLRSSPTTRRDNIIGKVENEEAIEVWDQPDESWLMVRKDDGLIGFLHRSQIDFDNLLSVASESEAPGRQSKPGVPRQYPFATTLPGKPGYVLNPYTNTIVDVRGLLPGTLVRDPRDPDESRAFRVPLDGTPGRAVIVDE